MGQSNNFENSIKNQLKIEKELYKLLQSDTTILPTNIKDSILNYIKTSKNIISKELFLNSNELKYLKDSLNTPPNKKPTTSTTIFTPNNNINNNNLLPDKLPVPEIDKKPNSTQSYPRKSVGGKPYPK